jgi:hypothetical protein
MRKDGFQRVILLTRTPVHAVYSAYRRFWRPRKGTKAEVAILHLKRHVSSLTLMQTIEREFPSLRVTYEDLVSDPKGELRKVAEFVGLVPVEWKYDVSKTSRWFGFSGIKNRNREGWKQDEIFCGVWKKYKGVFDALTI